MGVLLYFTNGEVKELVGFSGQVSYEMRISLETVLPTSMINQIRYQSIVLMVGALITTWIKDSLPFAVWVVCISVLLFMKGLKGTQGQYRFNKMIKPFPMYQ